MAGLLLSGPAGGGKSQMARLARAEVSGPAVIVDFQTTYAGLLGVERMANGRYPPRLPQDQFAIPLTEYLRRTAISAALVREVFPIVTNSDGSQGRRQELLGLLGAGSEERVIDPGRSVVEGRLSVDGELSDDCRTAISRWYDRL